MGRRTKIAFRLLIVAAIVLLGIRIELPYFYSMPGSAIELAPIVQIDGGYQDEKGTLMMTTVSLNRTNVWEYLYAQVNPSMELLKLNQVKVNNETDEQYFERQRENMIASQQKAIIVAFEKAGVPIEVKQEGAVLQNFIPGMPAEKVLKPGDRVIEVDHKSIGTGEDLIEAFKGKVDGDVSTVTIVRAGTTMNIEVIAAPFPEQYQTTAGVTRVGVGILSPETKLSIMPSREVKFNTENIGGPSAGLMFTLELINQLTADDITKGHRIAGTGTMDLSGKVGPIGGAKHKVVAAEREGAEYFLAPNIGTPETNYREALQSATAKGLKIKVIPITTINDALSFLSQLPRE